MPKAIITSNEQKNYKSEIKELSLPELKKGEVLIQANYTSINYKDALAVTGKGRILKSFPLVPGIDVSGVVEQSSSEKFKVGDRVFQTGGNLGEAYNGGLSEKVILKDEHCLLSPDGLTDLELMTLGTAGFTAALAIYKMELNHLSKNYSVLVTGASGGVGNFAVQMLSQKKYEVTAMTGKEEAGKWLQKLGATQVISPDTLNNEYKALESIKWSGCIDNVGGKLLKNIIPHIDLYGQVASIGLAGGHELNTTVMPFILRGVNLLGVSSNNCPKDVRVKIWQNLSNSLKPKFLQASHLIGLDQVIDYSNELLSRKITGRIVVKL